jgi:hypothetical protein
MHTLTGKARRWEPRPLRLRLFAIAGRLTRGSRRLPLRLAQNWPRAADITAAITSPASHPIRLTSRYSPNDEEGETQGPWNPTHPARQPGSQARPNAEIRPQASASARHPMSAKDRG